MHAGASVLTAHARSLRFKEHLDEDDIVVNLDTGPPWRHAGVWAGVHGVVVLLKGNIDLPVLPRVGCQERVQEGQVSADGCSHRKDHLRRDACSRLQQPMPCKVCLVVPTARGATLQLANKTSSACSSRPVYIGSIFKGALQLLRSAADMSAGSTWKQGKDLVQDAAVARKVALQVGVEDARVTLPAVEHQRAHLRRA